MYVYFVIRELHSQKNKYTYFQHYKNRRARKAIQINTVKEPVILLKQTKSQ